MASKLIGLSSLAGTLRHGETRGIHGEHGGRLFRVKAQGPEFFGSTPEVFPRVPRVLRVLRVTG